MLSKTHILNKRIYYHDTDCGGVVYYANYLKYLEEARTEFLLTRNINLKELYQKHNILFVVKTVNIDYKAPARYLDSIDIYTEIKKLKNVSVEFLQKVQKDQKVLVIAETVLVCVNKDFTPTQIPEFIACSLNVL